MARTSKSRGATPFTMKSGNKTSFKMMGSKSPMRNEDGNDNKSKTYSQTLNMVTADMTNAQLRDLAKNQHTSSDGTPKANKYNVGYNTLIKQRRALINAQKTSDPKEVEVEVKETETTEDMFVPHTISNYDAEAITRKYGGGVLTGEALAARTQAYKDAAADYARRHGNTGL